MKFYHQLLPCQRVQTRIRSYQYHKHANGLMGLKLQPMFSSIWQSYHNITKKVTQEKTSFRLRPTIFRCNISCKKVDHEVQHMRQMITSMCTYEVDQPLQPTEFGASKHVIYYLLTEFKHTIYGLGTINIKILSSYNKTD